MRKESSMMTMAMTMIFNLLLLLLMLSIQLSSIIPFVECADIIFDETLGNGEDDQQLKQPTHPYTKETETQQQLMHHSHHTFASARHDHNHDDKSFLPPPLPAATNTNDGVAVMSSNPQQQQQKKEGGTPSTTTTTPNSDNNVMVTENKHVTIQKSYLPYGAQGHNPDGDCQDTQYIVTCEPNTKNDCYRDLDELGVRVVKVMRFTDYYAICIGGEEDTADIDTILNLPTIKTIENDPERQLAVYLRHGTDGTTGGGDDVNDAVVNKNNEQQQQKNKRDTSVDNRHHRYLAQDEIYGLRLMQVQEFWEEYPDIRGQGVTVCVVDTGLYVDHEDINSSKATGSTSPDLVQPWNEDGYTHGTHVAGIVAAMDNNVGIVGVAPEANIYVARVFDEEGVFRASSLIEAMKECKNGGSHVINMSIGGDSTSLAEKEQIDELHENDGILIVAAAGNFGMEGNLFSYPGGYSNVFSVGAVDQNEKIAAFSCFNDEVSVVSAGVGIKSLTTESTKGYGFLSGTSQATPYVAGVGALLFQKFPSKTAAEIWDAITYTAKDLGACGIDPVYGSGLVQALDAAKYLEDPDKYNEENGRKRRSRNLDESCVKTEMKVVMPANEDEAGNSTRYDIQLVENEAQDNYVLHYRRGNFDVGETYNHVFYLRDDECYRLVFWDEDWEGFNENAGGYYELKYDGVAIVSNQIFGGSDEIHYFGDCDESVGTSTSTTATATASQQQHSERNTGIP